MGVKVRERKPGEWWVFVIHKGRRKAKKVGKPVAKVTNSNREMANRLDRRDESAT